jgi:hypothetical protein
VVRFDAGGKHNGDTAPFGYIRRCKDGAYNDFLPFDRDEEKLYEAALAALDDGEPLECDDISIESEYKLVKTFMANATASREAQGLSLESAQVLRDTLWLRSKRELAMEEWVGVAVKLLASLGLAEPDINVLEVCPIRTPCYGLLNKIYRAVAASDLMADSRGAWQAAHNACGRAQQHEHVEYYLQHPVLKGRRTSVLTLFKPMGMNIYDLALVV